MPLIKDNIVSSDQADSLMVNAFHLTREEPWKIYKEENIMQKYIGFKMVEAQLEDRRKDNNCEFEKGYKVVYPDGYVSWCPKKVFEKAYMAVGNDNTITQQNVDSFILATHVSTIGNKTTLVRTILVNGFEIIEASTCVDPRNYDEKIGAEICKKKIEDKIWMLLGFLLQTAVKGTR